MDKSNYVVSALENLAMAKDEVEK